jgi:hypothetical protein
LKPKEFGSFLEGSSNGTIQRSREDDWSSMDKDAQAVKQMKIIQLKIEVKRK